MPPTNRACVGAYGKTVSKCILSPTIDTENRKEKFYVQIKKE